MKLFTLRNTFASFGASNPQSFCYLNEAMVALDNAAGEVVEAKYHARFDCSEETVLVKRPSAIDPKERAWEQALFDRAEKWSERNGIASNDEGAFMAVDEIMEACKTGFIIELNFSMKDPLLLTEMCFNDFPQPDDRFEDFLADVEHGIEDGGYGGCDLQVLHAGEGGCKVGVGFNGEMLLVIGEAGLAPWERSKTWLETRAAAVVAEVYAWTNSDDPRKGYSMPDERRAASLAALRP